MTPEQLPMSDEELVARSLERGYRDPDLSAKLAQRRMLRALDDMAGHARDQRRVLLSFGFAVTHPLCGLLNDLDRDFTARFLKQRDTYPELNP